MLMPRNDCCGEVVCVMSFFFNLLRRVYNRNVCVICNVECFSEIFCSGARYVMEDCFILCVG